MTRLFKGQNGRKNHPQPYMSTRNDVFGRHSRYNFDSKGNNEFEEEEEDANDFKRSPSPNSAKNYHYNMQSTTKTSPQSVTAFDNTAEDDDFSINSSRSQNSRDLRRLRLNKQLAKNKRPAISLSASLHVIFSAFWTDCCLYRHVLHTTKVPIPTPQKLRNAYFRRGRQVLSTPIDGTHTDDLTTLSLRDNSIMSSIQTKIPISRKAKMEFTAISLSYEILSSPILVKEYDEFCTRFPPRDQEWGTHHDKTDESSTSDSSNPNWNQSELDDGDIGPCHSNHSVGGDSFTSGLSASTGISQGSILRRKRKQRRPGTKSSSSNSVSWNEEVEEIVILVEGDTDEEESCNNQWSLDKTEKSSVGPKTEHSSKIDVTDIKEQDELFSVDFGESEQTFDTLGKEVQNKKSLDEDTDSLPLWYKNKKKEEKFTFETNLDEEQWVSDFETKAKIGKTLRSVQENNVPMWVKNRQENRELPNTYPKTSQHPVWADLNVELDENGWIAEDAEKKPKKKSSKKSHKTTTTKLSTNTGFTDDVIIGFDLCLGNYIKNLVSDMKTGMDQMGANWNDVQKSEDVDESSCPFIPEQELDALMDILKTEINNKVENIASSKSRDSDDKETTENDSLSKDGLDESSFWDDWIWNKR